MTIQHDLSLNPDSRLQRRVSNLEQGYIANQQTGAWGKTILQCGEFVNGSESLATVNCLSFEIPIDGQYLLMSNNDTELRTADGFPYLQLQVNGGIIDAFNSFNRSGRHDMHHSWAGYITKGSIVRVAGAISVPQPGAFIAVYSGNLVIVKLA